MKHVWLRKTLLRLFAAFLACVAILSGELIWKFSLHDTPEMALLKKIFASLVILACLSFLIYDISSEFFIKRRLREDITKFLDGNNYLLNELEYIASENYDYLKVEHFINNTRSMKDFLKEFENETTGYNAYGNYMLRQSILNAIKVSDGILYRAWIGKPYNTFTMLLVWPIICAVNLILPVIDPKLIIPDNTIYYTYHRIKPYQAKKISIMKLIINLWAGVTGCYLVFIAVELIKGIRNNFSNQTPIYYISLCLLFAVIPYINRKMAFWLLPTEIKQYTNPHYIFSGLENVKKAMVEIEAEALR